ncbi:MAG TPA: glycosyltransferase family 1 protein [Acidimicrobiales bacterium]|nr:glycosyltransferase family 1 protein [Acidimicrobiales bacterium]
MVLGKKEPERRARMDEIASSRPVALARHIVQGIYWRYRTVETGHLTELVLARNNTIFVPELVGEERDVETLLRYKRQLGTRLAALFYDAVPLTHPHFCSDDILVQYAKYCRFIGGVDTLLPISRAAGQSARQLANLVGNSGVTTIDVPLPASAIAGAESQRSGVPARSTNMLLCVGSFEPRKNHVRVLRAVRMVHASGVDVRLVLVGGSGWRGQRIESEIDAVRAAGVDIVVRKSVADHELSELYSAARAVVFVSQAEGFGLPIAEALAHATPVICSGIGSMAELASGGGCLTVPPTDTGQIADALTYVLQDARLHDRLTREAASRPVESWDDYARRLIDALFGDQAGLTQRLPVG